MRTTLGKYLYMFVYVRVGLLWGVIMFHYFTMGIHAC